MTGVLWAALTLVALAGAVDLLAGVSRRWTRPVRYLLGAAACVLLTVVGAAGVAGHGPSVGLDEILGAGPTRLVVDPLSGLFLLIAFAVAVPVSLVCASWSRPAGRIRSRGLGAAYALTLGAVAVILTADNTFCFLFAWETLSPPSRSSGSSGSSSSAPAPPRISGRAVRRDRWPASVPARSGSPAWPWPR